MKVDILLACYNGSAYISEQVESILNQTHQNFVLYIRDDGSTDDTVDIINRFDDPRIVIVNDTYSNVGVAENFRILMGYSNSEYILFSDQDDYWCENKIDSLLGEAELKFKKNEPSLVYSQGEVVDSALSSLGKYATYEKTVSSISDVVFLNGGIQGCAMLFNRSLLQLVLEDKSFWYMHDQIVTLYCVIFGSVYFKSDVLFLYRQHNSNVLGYSSQGWLGYVVRGRCGRKNLGLVHKKSFDSINSFYKNNSNLFDSDTNGKLKSFIGICNSNKLMAAVKLVGSSFKLKSSKLRLLIKLLLCKDLVGK